MKNSSTIKSQRVQENSFIMVKKVAFVVTDFPALSETFIINQMNGVVSLGYQVSILCTGKSNQNVGQRSLSKYRLIDKLLPINNLPTNKLIRLFYAIYLFIKNLEYASILLTAFNWRKYGRQSVDLQQFYRLINGLVLIRNQYDVVHIHFGQNAVYLLPILSLIEKRTKLLVSFHGFDVHDFNQSFYAQLIRKDYITTSNTEYTAQLLRKMGFSGIRILPESLDSDLFSVTDKTIGDNINILFVGRLIQWKAPNLVIEVMRILIHEYELSCTCDIVGDGSFKKHCLDLIKQYRLKNYVTIHGAQPQVFIKDLMLDAQIFLYPGIIGTDGRCENQGLVIQEAQAMKLVPFVSKVGGMHEGIDDMKTGFLFKEKDVRSFADKIYEMINNPEALRTIGEKAREQVIQKYDNIILAKKLSSWYET